MRHCGLARARRRVPAAGGERARRRTPGAGCAHTARGLGHTEKLKKQGDFAAVLARGRAWSAYTVRLIVTPNHRPRSRCGFITSKRLGNAVTRNRVRRRLRESVRAHYPHVRPGLDLVFIARPAAAAASFRELDRHVCTALRRARLLPPHYRPRQASGASAQPRAERDREKTTRAAE